ncbi:MAG: NAD(P)-dependent oxidoreductase [Gemmatimonadetes bacterium]|nr:NAD(P)-dependent oxidoreductase [Gemmatimonadota bacterium]
MTAVAFLGTGLLGSAFVEAALQRGDQVTAWNRTPGKARALEAFGARVAATPADAVRGADRVHLVLKDDGVVDQIVEQLRPGLGAQAIVIDHTTTQPALTAERVRRLNTEGVRFLHCPVFIGPAMARKAQGTILASGPAALFDLVKDALQLQAARVEYLGERPDLAAVQKLCGNAFLLGVAALVADVFAIGRGAGLDPLDTLKPLEILNLAAVVAGRGKNMAAGNFTPSFELTMARKDVRLMIETAATSPLAMLPGLAARMDALIAEGYGALDVGVLAKGAAY